MEILCYFYRFSRYASDIEISRKKAMKDKTKELKEMLALVDDAQNVLVSKGSLNEFGRMLDHTWKLKRGITNKISNDSIDAVYKGLWRLEP